MILKNHKITDHKVIREVFKKYSEGLGREGGGREDRDGEYM